MEHDWEARVEDSFAEHLEEVLGDCGDFGETAILKGFDTEEAAGPRVRVEVKRLETPDDLSVPQAAYIKDATLELKVETPMPKEGAAMNLREEHRARLSAVRSSVMLAAFFEQGKAPIDAAGLRVLCWEPGDSNSEPADGFEGAVTTLEVKTRIDFYGV